MRLSDMVQDAKWRIMDILHIEDFGMYSIRGNAKVARMVRQADSLPEEQRQEFMEQEMSLIAERYPEVYDTDVRESIQEMCPGYSAY